MTTQQLAAGIDRSLASNRDFRRVRHIKRNMQLHRQVRDLVGAYTDATYVGPNPAVEALAAGLGFEAHDLCVTEIRFGARLITLIVVPHHVWRRPERMARAIQLRDLARCAGSECILVPQGLVERQPRLGNASLLGVVGSAVRVGATDRMRVLAHLIENGDCALGELAALVEHRDPYGAILHLAASGVVRIDLYRCISPTTMIGLPDPRFDIAS